MAYIIDLITYRVEYCVRYNKYGEHNWRYDKHLDQTSFAIELANVHGGDKNNTTEDTHNKSIIK